MTDNVELSPNIINVIGGSRGFFHIPSMKQDIAKQPDLLGKTMFSPVHKADNARRATSTACSLGYASGWPVSVAVSGEKPQLLAAVLRPAHMR